MLSKVGNVYFMDGCLLLFCSREPVHMTQKGWLDYASVIWERSTLNLTHVHGVSKAVPAV